MEAAWRIQKFPLCGRCHKWETTLTAWINLNKKDDLAKKIKYANIPCMHIRMYFSYFCLLDFLFLLLPLFFCFIILTSVRGRSAVFAVKQCTSSMHVSLIHK